MSKLTVLKEHLASLQMLYNDKHLGKRNLQQNTAYEDIKQLAETIMVLQNQNIDISNIEVHFEEVKPDSKNILTKLFESFKN